MEIYRYEGSALGHVAPQERDRMRAYSNPRLRGDDAPVTYEFEGIHKDGTQIWLENRARVITWKGKTAVQRTLVDITERKRAEENLREALDRGYDCLTLEDCCGAPSRESHDHAMAIIRGPAGVFGTVAASNAVLTALHNPPDNK